jgi:hypothetical protein
MRTSLAIGLTTSPQAPIRARSAKRAFPLAIGAIAWCMGSLPGHAALAGEVGSSLLARSVASSKSAVCRVVDEVEPALFSGEFIAAYDFTGASAEKLQQVMDVGASSAAPKAAVIHLVLVPATDEAIAFQFGTDGCHTGTLQMDFAGMALVFEKAGVHAPFGPTFYQLPGAAT